MLNSVSKPAIDLAQLVKRREQLAYEHHLARSTYAYGVDLRRAAWLDRSTVGDPLMRTVDRRWNELIAGLTADALLPSSSTLSNEVMDEVLRLVRMLHAPWPSIRLLQPSVAEQWPVVTPLGTTKGGSHWLVIDAQRLEACSSTERTFLIAGGLSNLQCDHGPLFAAHLMAHRRGRGEGMVRTLLRPWSKVSVFSSDRAGLLGVAELDAARDALRAHADPGIAWLPAFPDVAARIRAVEDFSKSRLLTRLRLSGPAAGWSLAPRLVQPGQPDESASDAQPPTTDKPVDAQPSAPDKPEPPADPTPPARPSADPEEREHPDDTIAAAEAEGERIAAEEEARDQRRDAQEDELAEARAKEKALAEAWSLARCDQRLTRRLGLL